MSQIILYKNKNIEELESKIPYVNDSFTHYVKAPFEEPLILETTGEDIIIEHLSERTVMYIIKAIIAGMIKDKCYYIHYKNENCKIETFDVRDKDILNKFNKDYLMNATDDIFASSESDGETFFYDLDEKYYDDEDSYYDDNAIFSSYDHGFLHYKISEFLPLLPIDVPISYNLGIVPFKLYRASKHACEIIKKYNKYYMYENNSRLFISDNDYTNLSLFKYQKNSDILTIEIENFAYRQILGNILWHLRKLNRILFINGRKLNIDYDNMKSLSFDDFIKEISTYSNEALTDSSSINIEMIPSNYRQFTSDSKTGEILVNREIITSISKTLYYEYNSGTIATINISYLPSFTDLKYQDDLDILFMDN